MNNCIIKYQNELEIYLKENNWIETININIDEDKFYNYVYSDVIINNNINIGNIIYDVDGLLKILESYDYFILGETILDSLVNILNKLFNFNMDWIDIDCDIDYDINFKDGYKNNDIIIDDNYNIIIKNLDRLDDVKHEYINNFLIKLNIPEVKFMIISSILSNHLCLMSNISKNEIYLKIENDILYYDIDYNYLINFVSNKIDDYKFLLFIKFLYELDYFYLENGELKSNKYYGENLTYKNKFYGYGETTT